MLHLEMLLQIICGSGATTGNVVLFNMRKIYGHIFCRPTEIETVDELFKMLKDSK
jgi:hypothetical protein